MTTTPLEGRPIEFVRRQIEQVFAIVRGASGQDLYRLDIIPVAAGREDNDNFPPTEGGEEEDSRRRILFCIHRTTPIDQILLAAPQFPQCITADVVGEGEDRVITELRVRAQTPLYPEEAIERVFAPWEQKLICMEQLDEFLLLHLAPALSAFKTVRLMVQDNPDWVLKTLPERSRAGWAKVVESVHRLITITLERQDDSAGGGRLVFVVRNASRGTHITLGVNAKLYPVRLQPSTGEETTMVRFVEPLLQHMLQRSNNVVEPGSNPSRYLEHAGFIKHTLEAPTTIHPTTQAVLEFIFSQPEFEDEEEDDDEDDARDAIAP